MAKHHKSIKGHQLVSNRGQGASFEHQESIDDSLLPDALELSKLKELDPDIISWIKERTAKEQDARLSFNDRKMTVIERAQTKTFTIDIIALVLAFFIIMGGMLFSYLLISLGQVVTGSVFAGVTILFAANSFLNFRKRIQIPQAKKDEK